MKTIVGVFDNAREAESAAAELVSSGFPRGDVKVVEEKAATGLAAGDPVDLLVDYGLPQDDAKAYVEEIHDGGALLAVKAQDAQAPRAMDILRQHGLREDMTGLESASAAGATLTQDQLKAGETIPVVEEQIRVGKRLIRRGGVLVHTHVTETPVEEQVTLREEKVKLERHPTDRPVTPADMAAFKEGTIEVTETVEQPVIAKEARVVEEVTVGKQTQERTEVVGDTVRRTDVEVERRADIGTAGTVESSRTMESSAVAAGPAATSEKFEYTTPTDQTSTLDAGATAEIGARSFDSFESDFQSHFNDQISVGGGRYEQFRPAYRYGYDMAISRNLSGRDWDGIEMDAKRRWEELNPGTWDRYEPAIHYSWDHVRGLR